MTTYSLDTTLAVTATTSTADTRKTLIDVNISPTATITTGIGRIIGLSTTIATTAAVTETTQASLKLSSTTPITADIETELFPPINSFTAVLDLTAIIADYTDVGTAPDRQPISCTITFTPRLGKGQIIWVPGMGVALAPIVARCDTDGVLRTIAGGNGVELIANTPILGLTQLIYDVTFTNVVYNKADQYIAPFAFEAPTTAGTVVDLSRVTKLDPKVPDWYS